MTRDGEDGIAVEETDRLIASDKVEGTAVYSRDGERLGSIAKVMIDKVTGQVPYAVLTLGGVVGVGEPERHYPLPWRALTYDTERAGYVVDIDRARLTAAPGVTGATPAEFGRHVDEYYGFY